MASTTQVKSLKKQSLRPLGMHGTVGNGRVLDLTDEQAKAAIDLGSFEPVKPAERKSSTNSRG